MSSIYFVPDFKYYICISLTIPKGKQEAANFKMTGTDKTIAKKKKLKVQRMIYKSLHRRLKIQQHEHHSSLLLN